MMNWKLSPIQICFQTQIIPGLVINQRNYTRRNIFSREPANEERRKEDPQRKHQNGGFTAVQTNGEEIKKNEQVEIKVMN